jgi:hypothetical protein
MTTLMAATRRVTNDPPWISTRVRSIHERSPTVHSVFGNIDSQSISQPGHNFFSRDVLGKEREVMGLTNVAASFECRRTIGQTPYYNEGISFLARQQLPRSLTGVLCSSRS